MSVRRVAFDTAIFGFVGAAVLVALEGIGHMFGIHVKDFLYFAAPMIGGVYHAVYHYKNFCRKFFYGE